jgi:predicted Fe-Mo cluster-binding NifX family protein
MKIAIPVVDEQQRKFEIAGSLNVIGCLCIFDTDTQEGRWMKTLDLAPNMGELLPALERETVKILITRQIHPMALKVLVGKGLDVFQSQGRFLEDNIKLFSDNQLLRFDMAVSMNFAKVCGGECDGCKTDCEEETTNP